MNEVTANRTPHAHMFNKLNGMHLYSIFLNGPLNHYTDDKMFYTRTADFDPVTDVVVGGLDIADNGVVTDNFKIVPITEMPDRVYERSLNLAAEEKITKKYPVADQLSIVARTLEKIAKATGVDVEELSEMLSYIDLCLTTNKAQKEFYRENSDIEYVSDEKAASDFAASMEGGIHEHLGARLITGGRIFGSDRGDAR